MKPGRLVFPALRWRAGTGFAAEEPTIERGLALDVGGFILFGGTASEVARLTQTLMQRAGRPLLVGADLERGAGQQFDGLSELPPPAALAALADPEAVEAAGALTAREARSVGVNWVFAPVADLDIEPENPIVQTRSFGRDPERVGALVTRWVRGCQDEGALACAKHFPGHGRTRHDSHDRLPVVSATAAELEAGDLVPFRAAVEAGVASVMTAHVAFPALDPTGAAATCSAPILGRLRRDLGFDGLVVSDALTMEGLRQGRAPEAAAIAALAAGVDALLYPPDPAALVRALTAAADRDPRVAAAVERAEARLVRAVTRASLDSPGGGAATAARDLADRLVRQTLPAGLELRAPLELVVVDDDVDGAYPASPNDWLERRLVERGVPLGPGGGRLVAAFAEPRASKGRGGFGRASSAALAAATPGAGLVALFGHPRLAGQVPPGPPVAQLWHRQRLMQEALADWLAPRIR